MEHVFLSSEGPYRGKYVAFDSGRVPWVVVGASENPKESLVQAHASGVDEPVLLYVPEENEHISI